MLSLLVEENAILIFYTKRKNREQINYVFNSWILI